MLQATCWSLTTFFPSLGRELKSLLMCWMQTFWTTAQQNIKSRGFGAEAQTQQPHTQPDEALPPSEVPDFTAHKYSLCWIITSPLLLGADLMARQRTAGYSTGQHCPSSGENSNSFFHLLPHPTIHLNFSISQGIHSQLNDCKKQLKCMDSNLRDSFICCAINQQQWWDSISHTAAALPNVPSKKSVSRVG